MGQSAIPRLALSFGEDGPELGLYSHAKCA